MVERYTRSFNFSDAMKFYKGHLGLKGSVAHYSRACMQIRTTDATVSIARSTVKAMRHLVRNSSLLASIMLMYSGLFHRKWLEVCHSL